MCGYGKSICLLDFLFLFCDLVVFCLVWGGGEKVGYVMWLLINEKYYNFWMLWIIILFLFFIFVLIFFDEK